MREVLRGGFVFLFLFALSTPARAQSDADRATARTLARDAEQALNAKDYPKAIDLFTRADALVHAPTLLVALAHAEIGMGKLVEAQETLVRVAREGVAPNAPPAFARAIESARKELAAIEPRVPSVVIQVAGAKDVHVTIDDAPVPSAALGVKRAVNPGAHVVRANAEGFAQAEARFTVAEGGSESVRLELQPATAAQAASTALPPAASVDAPAPAAGSTQRIVGFTAIGFGVAGLGLGAVTGGLAIGKRNDALAACKNGCSASQSDRSSYYTLGTVSTIGFVAGGTVAVGGVVLVATAPKRPAAGWIAPRLGPGYAGVEGVFW